ncbi:MAG: sodium:solute symporter [Bacteroidota bacterium]
MNYLDYLIILGYSLGFLYLGYRFKDNASGEDYFLGGKSLGWFPLAMSTAATQLSAISFISAPAFVGLKENGGMQWLTFEFGVPIAMLLVMSIIIPPLYRSGMVSIYEFLEKRFDKSSRLLISLVFQISRALGTGVMVYTMAIILESVFQISFTSTILLVAVITMIYSYQGGMRAVVYGDMIQMIVLFGGIVICFAYGLSALGGWEEFLLKVDRSRLGAVDYDSLGFNNDEFGVWPMLFGGIVLYTSYYGCDQSQAQRLLSASSLGEVRKTLLVNGLFRFPVTLTYCVMGLIIGTLALTDKAFLQAIPTGEPDKMIPVFILQYLPHGVIGILVVAILSAAMSSLSSAINSLSAVFVEDFIVRGKEVGDATYVRYSRYASVFWGVVCMGFAFFAGDIADTVIEAVNKIGSVFYGPILAMFVMAITMRSITTRAANLGLLIGVGINIYLWLERPEVFWFWWNLIGLLTTLGSAYVLSFVLPDREQKALDLMGGFVFHPREASILLTFFAAIFLLANYLEFFF